MFSRKNYHGPKQCNQGGVIHCTSVKTVGSLQHRLLADLIIMNSATLTSNRIVFSMVCNLFSKNIERNMLLHVNKIEFGPS